MQRLICMLWKRKITVSVLFLSCIVRSIDVLFLNKGYAELVDRILNGQIKLITNSAIILLSTGIMQVVVLIFQNYISSILSEKTGNTIRETIMEGFLKADFKTIENQSTGDSLAKLNKDLSCITTWIRIELSALLSDSVLFVIILIAMLFTNWRLTLISFFIVPFFSIISYLLSKPITNAETEKNKALSEVTIITKSILDAFPILKVFEMEQPILNKSKEIINISVISEIKANSIRAKLMSVNGFLSFTPTVLLLGVGGFMAIQGSISAGALLAFINMSSFVTGPLLNLPARIDSVRTASANISSIFNLLDDLIFDVNDGKKMLLNRKGKEIHFAVQFENVTFGYSEYSNTLKNISFKIPIGSKVVIVGESGCGKSTILKLIAGLYPITSGNVLFFGSDLEHTDLNSLRNYISFIPQESQLFPVSIYENITCGHVMSLENVIAACKAAQLETLIDSLPSGIYTKIGEYGNTLSGGERQRICTARAIAKNAPLFLLDEATSAMDAGTESKILDFIDSLVGLKTIIFVTHKLKNAVNADLIICMKNGQICETGTHENLIKSNGYYARLFNLQNIAATI